MPPAEVDSFRRSRAAVATTFATHAVVTGGLGPWIPQLKSNCDLGHGGLGVALTGFAAGLVVGTRLATPAIRRSGGRLVVRIGIPILAAGFALLPAARGVASLTAIFAGFGVAAGLLDVAMNTEAVAVERRFGRRVMSAMHGMWSLSMFAGTAVAAAGVAAHVPIEIQLPIVAAVLVAASHPILGWLPQPHEAAGPLREAGAASPARATPAPTGRVVLLCLIAAAVFLTEGIAADWSAVYLREWVGAAPGTASLAVVAFSAGMAVSRFAGDPLAARFEQSVLVRTGTAVAALSLATALLVGGVVPTIAAHALIGLSLGPVVPFTFRAAGAIPLEGGRTSLAIVVTAAYLGSIVGPMLVGFIAEEVGLRAAFFVPVVACLAAAVAAGAAREAR
jgi:fucose permease